MWEFWRSHLKKDEKDELKERKKKRMGMSVDLTSQTARMFSAPAERVKQILAGLKDTEGAADHVHFKDMRLAVESDSEEDDAGVPGDETAGQGPSATPARRKRVLVERHKLIIILVGLPGRGKTFLCNKIKSYLTWLGHPTRHFNVGMYRRHTKGEGEVQDAAFFDSNNQAGMDARKRALDFAIHDMLDWLSGQHSQVAIFDATNTTHERRDYLRSFFHCKIPYLFIESICNDYDVLEQNYRYKMLYSPDYAGCDMEAAMRDFKLRITKYEEVYEPITQENLHYIKLIDMVTGRGQMVLNRISGYIPGKLVFFLMQICKHGLAKPRKIWLSRHGESQYNQSGKIGGDSVLSDLGSKYARKLSDLIIDRVPLDLDGKPLPVSVWTSTLKRTILTAQNIPFPKLRWKALDEIQAGEMEGMTYKEIEKEMPDEFEARKLDKLKYRYPRGESYLDLVQRLEPVVIEVERERECVFIVGHQAVLRVIYGYLMNVPQHEIPTLNVPLHTLIELTPKPDGTMYEERFFIDVNAVDAAGETIGGVPRNAQSKRQSRRPSQHGGASREASRRTSRDVLDAADLLRQSVDLAGPECTPGASLESTAAPALVAGTSLYDSSVAPTPSPGVANEVTPPVPQPQRASAETQNPVPSSVGSAAIPIPRPPLSGGRATQPLNVVPKSSHVGSEDLMEHLTLLDQAAKEARSRHRAVMATGASMPNLQSLHSPQQPAGGLAHTPQSGHGAHPLSQTGALAAEPAPGLASLQPAGMAPRPTKSTLDLSQLLPEKLPDANKDVVNKYEGGHPSIAGGQPGGAFAHAPAASTPGSLAAPPYGEPAGGGSSTATPPWGTGGGGGKPGAVPGHRRQVSLGGQVKFGLDGVEFSAKATKPHRVHGNTPAHGNPGHPLHPGNYTPNQDRSPASSEDGREDANAVEPTQNMYYGKPVTDHH